MSIRLLATFLCFALWPVFAQEAANPPMTTYVIGLLRRGPNYSTAETEESRKIQEGHMANIHKMGESGKLLTAGPLMDGGELRGIFIFQNTTIEEARAMVNRDPAVISGRLVLELHPWFAPKGLKVDPGK